MGGPGSAAGGSVKRPAQPLAGPDRAVCCGAARLATLELKISATLIERLNLPQRNGLAPLTRKSPGFCKDRTQLRRRVVFFQALYNSPRPHQSLHYPLLAAEPACTGFIDSK